MPLELGVRELLESRFRTDLGDVRLHHNFGGSAPAAFTEGLDVRFGAGAFRPQTAAGLRLLSHEVAHAVQQRDAASGGASTHAEDGRETAESDAAQAAEA